MTIAFISIFVITGVAWLVRKVTPFKICPICAGIAGTWSWMLAGILIGLIPASFILPVAILMGGSVVGIAYQLEKRLPPGRSFLAWKSLFIPTGFAAAYGLITASWPIAAGALAAMGALAAAFLRKNGGTAQPSVQPDGKAGKGADLEEKMKQCC